MKWLFSDPRRSLRISGGLIAVGLLAEAITLFFNHPFAFMGFIFFGGTLVGLGVVLYLWTVVSVQQHGSELAPVTAAPKKESD